MTKKDIHSFHMKETGKILCLSQQWVICKSDICNNSVKVLPVLEYLVMR